MLLSPLQVKQAMALGLQDVREALTLGGYLDNQDITGVCYLGMNQSSQFLYQIQYQPPGRPRPELGTVFIRWHECDGEWNLVGDF